MRATCAASGPALVRVVLMWMAVALRLITLWAFLVVDVESFLRFSSAIHWGMRLRDPAYLEFTSLRAEAHRIRGQWASGEISDAVAREESIRLTAALWRWRESTEGLDLFMATYEYAEAPGCPPFGSAEELVELLEGQEWDERFEEYFCEYLILFE